MSVTRLSLQNNDSSIFVVASPSSQSFSPISFRSSCPGKPGNDNRAPNMRNGFGVWKMIIMIINMVSVHKYILLMVEMGFLILRHVGMPILSWARLLGFLGTLW